MARSTCVYVVMRTGAMPVAGFTVRHELITWLTRHPEVREPDFAVWRCGDGLSQNGPLVASIADLLQKGQK